jgi:hypothetical protein
MRCTTRKIKSSGRCSPGKFKPRSLQEIVLRYVEKHRQEALDELAEFRKRPDYSLRDCIRQAGLAQRKDGKRLDHQRRIPPETLRAWANALLSKESTIGNCSIFAALHDLLLKESRNLWKHGELIVYDTALRIGAYHSLEPNEVYLHRGTREGAKALGFNGGRKTIAVPEFPEEFRQLTPREIEDCLCIYADRLMRLRVA